MIKNDEYYIEPLIDAHKNSPWASDEALFEEDTNGKLIRNFSDEFLNTWKETVDNWKDIHDGTELIKDGKLKSNILSIYEIISSYKSQMKVFDHVKNLEFYKNYLIENKHLYELMDMPGNSGYTQVFVPLNEQDFNKRKIVTINRDIWAILYRVGTSLVTFYDFFEDIKKQWKEYYPDAVKVIIRKESLKRFYGITDINNKGGFYRDLFNGDYNQFADYSIRYFYLMPDGNLIGR